MQRIIFRIVSGILVCLASLVFPSGLWAQNDAPKVFQARCSLCHSANGSGDSATGKAVKAKDLRSDEVQKQSDAQLAEVIARGEGKMPAFGSKLSPDAIKSLVAYLRELPKQ